MKISIQKLPKSQIEILIELPSKEFDEYVERATLNLGKDLQVEGFRPGKAPKEIIEKEVGKEKILKEAAEEAVKENYIKAILDNGIEAISRPEIQILKVAPGNPLEFKAKTQIIPEVNLPDYKKIAPAIKKKKIFIDQKEVEGALLWIQKSRAKRTLKQGPCQKGDFVKIEFSSSQIEGGVKKEDGFILGEGHLIPGFEENLEGMKEGEEKEFSLVFPKTHFQKELVGKKIDFKVKMKSVQKVEPPEINDQFVQSLGQFKNLTALKESIKQGLNSEKEIAEQQRVRQEILERIAKNSEADLPEILVAREKRQMVENLKRGVSQNLQISFEDYLNRIKKSEKELKDSFSSEAEKRVKNFLILREISKKENIEVSEEELKEEINKALKRYPDIEKAGKEFDLDSLKEYIRGVIRNEKTLQFLEKFSKI